MSQFPPPQSPYPPSYPPPPPAFDEPDARPMVVTVIAIIGICLAALGLICGGLALVGMAASAANPVGVALKNGGVYTISLAVAALGPILAIVLLTGSIGALGLKPWARTMLIAYGVATIVVGAIDMFLTIKYIQPATAQGPQGAAYNVGVSIGMIFRLAFPIIVLVAMNQANVKQAFSKAR